ncbi:MAG: MGMT family protein [Ardenticatenaceae bacterium]|nr:MGMT family protein [Anaerolineales bacterium]MCB8939822.1 MGMT family protein [Ardenticatenaceae bacterium]MCB8975095.1 MGMT family protein [Ardenticatenaceae bacterium]
MALQEDLIVDIPPERVKFFGTTGKMLLPSVATVAALVAQIPASRLLTTTQLRQTLTVQFNVQGTCPVTTRKALKAIAQDASSTVPSWRVINQDGGLLSVYPGGKTAQAARLQAEGLEIELGKMPKVKNFTDSLVDSGG